MKYLLAVKTIFIHNKRFFMDVITHKNGTYYVVLRDKIEDVKKHLPVSTSLKDVSIKLKDDKEIKRIYGDKPLDPKYLCKNSIYRDTDEEFNYLPAYSIFDSESKGITGAVDICMHVELENGTRKNHDIACEYTKIDDGDEYIHTTSYLFGRNDYITYSNNHGNYMCLNNTLGVMRNISYVVATIPDGKCSPYDAEYNKGVVIGTKTNLYSDFTMHFNKDMTIKDMHNYINNNFIDKYDIRRMELNLNNHTIELGVVYNGPRMREKGHKFFKVKKYGKIVEDVNELNSL